jgi:choline dehydrogenase-like flavoprotein
VYSKAFGGTTIHWEAKTPRLLPEDFSLMRLYGQGADWPIAYEDMTADYETAEGEIGVSADRRDQEYGGVKFSDGYEFPMHGLPLSYLDQQVDKGIDGTSVDLYGKSYPIKVRPYPQGRNSIPNKAYAGRKGYAPVGAVAEHQIEFGQRCQGNTNCVPICPVQARYHSGKTLAKAFMTDRAELLTKAVASRILVDSASACVDGIELKLYHDPNSAEYDTITVRGKIYVLAANAIETPRLMLASGLPSTSGLVGRNLMDHAYLLSWALMPQPCGAMRGTSSTGGIVDLRVGPFRRHQAAFAVDIHNDGWGWATSAPESDLRTLVDQYNKFGKDLREALIRRVSSQLLFAFMIEVPPDQSNRVSVSPRYVDPLGNMRPIVSFSAPEYTLRGASYARQFARLVFSRLGAEDYTAYGPDDYGLVSYGDETFALRGGNHLAGTHVMGSNRTTSVVTTDQRSWDHENLYLVGAGSMPTVGTANVTLTLAALCYRSARAMLRQLAAS